MLRFVFAPCLLRLLIACSAAPTPNISLMMAGDDRGQDSAGRSRGTPIGNLPGVVVDDVNALKQGRWKSGNRLDGYFGAGYLYTSDPAAAIEYLLQVPSAGRYELRLLYAAHKNRGHSVAVTVTQGIESTKRLINMQRAPTAGRYKSLGRITAREGQVVKVRIDAKGAGGVVHADAVQLVALD